jgi:hypothetical protein
VPVVITTERLKIRVPSAILKMSNFKKYHVDLVSEDIINQPNKTPRQVSRPVELVSITKSSTGAALICRFLV